jgi:cystathionine beta-lyase/cystathionine gamma-synthase
VDANDLAAVEQALATPARALLVETISNPLLRVADLPALAEIARRRQALLVVDNTFATPVLCRPLEFGAELVMESLTKMIGGHSDVMLGLLAGRGPDRFAELNQTVSVWGLSPAPFDSWLAARGLDTLALRMKAASENAAALAEWLAHQPGVARVLYPGRADHPDHEAARRVLAGGFGNVLGFDLAGGREAVNAFLRRGGVPFSPSLGHTTTTCSHPWTTSHRYVSPAEKLRQGTTEGLVRLSVGAEPLEEARAAIERGLGAEKS